MIEIDVTESICAVLNERNLYIVETYQPTLKEIALEHYGIERTYNSVVLSGDDLQAFGARVAEVLAERMNAQKAQP